MFGSLAASEIDEMVIVTKATRRLQRCRGRATVTSSQYMDGADLLRKLLLNASPPAVPLSPLAQTFIPKKSTVAWLEHQSRSSRLDHRDLGVESMQEESEGLQHVSYNSMQEDAVLQIQEFLRRYQLRKGGASGGPLFLAFNEAVRRFPTPDSRWLRAKTTYSIYLRGPMPHVLGFVEKLLVYIGSARKDLNQRMKDAEHQTLETLQRESKEIRSVLNRCDGSVLTRNGIDRALISTAEDVRHALGPGSSMHEAFSLPKLREWVEKIPEIKERSSKMCPIDADSSATLDYSRGIDFILNPDRGDPSKLSCTRPPRPTIIDDALRRRLQSLSPDLTFRSPFV